MTRKLRLALVASALLALLVGASPVMAGSGADFGVCVAHHATTEGGFGGGHHPGMHRGITGWPGCPG